MTIKQAIQLLRLLVADEASTADGKSFWCVVCDPEADLYVEQPPVRHKNTCPWYQLKQMQEKESE